MNGRTAKAIRKTASDASRATAAMVMPDFAALVRANQNLARRIDDLESRTGGLAQCVDALERFRSRSLLGRLGWLLLRK